MRKIYHLLLLLPVMALAQTSGQNYIKTTTYKTATATSISNPSPTDAVVQITYFDGLGRPVQQKAHKQSNTGKDIITPVVYDSQGRKSKAYLPYVNGSATLNYESDPVAGSLDYYGSPTLAKTGNPYQEATANPYSETFFEASPLGRPLKQAAPGNDWAGHTNDDNDHAIKFVNGLNTTADGVKKIETTVSWDSGKGIYEITAPTVSTYLQHQLYKSIVRNENWVSGTDNTTEEFKDAMGRVVLKRTYGVSIVDNLPMNVKHDTYYVYDQFGNLTYVIPPLATVGTNISQAVLDGLCYQYRYDHHNRLVEKKLPGKQWEFIVYDKLDRIVATGPAFSPFSDHTGNSATGWLITKYDIYSRPILTAYLPGTTAIDASARKALQLNYNNDTVINEAKTATNTLINGINMRYTTLAKPLSGYHLLTVNYYDDYLYNTPPTVSSQVENQTVFYTNTQKPIGLPTGEYVRIIEESNQYNREHTYRLYDHKARVIRQQTLNTATNGYVRYDSRLDFSGKVLYSVTRHKRTSADAELYQRDTYTYSPQDRLKLHLHRIGSAAATPQLMASNSYDELGQLIKKNVGGQDATGAVGLQKVDYAYNIRGWLTDINRINDNPDTNDLFNFRINYNTVGSASPEAEPLYNGNISQTWWKTASDNVLRKYDYHYDTMNRLTDAVYQKAENENLVNSYGESLSYDRNGNIKTLQRNGEYDDPVVYELEIDDLTYTYQANTNKLMAVYDDSEDPNGFNDGNIGSDDYDYDANGNMSKDLNKGITQIKYNHLNLPRLISFSNGASIEYLYTATGKKLKKTVTMGASVKTTEYLNGFQYEGGVLNFFPTASGYVKNTVIETTNNYNYVFTFTDHLGNVRLTYTEHLTTHAATIMEEDNYYAFGLKHKNYNMTHKEYFKSQVSLGGEIINFGPCVECPNSNQYKFNGVELQDELGLNVYATDMRQYDPAIARWTVLDPVIHHSLSPYNAFDNNPVF